MHWNRNPPVEGGAEKSVVAHGSTPPKDPPDGPGGLARRLGDWLRATYYGLRLALLVIWEVLRHEP
jgi:hypothetical protein